MTTKPEQTEQKKPLSTEDIYKKVMSIAKSKIEARGLEYTQVQHQEQLVYMLSMYFNRDPRFLKQKIDNTPNLQKGILLAGTTGLGKTIILDSFTEFFRNYPSYAIGKVTAIDLVDIYEVEKTAGLQRYKQGKLYIEDIGTEDIGNSFGKKNVVAYLLSHRYNLWCNTGDITLSCTNLTTEKLGSSYGDTIFSRLHEMMNIISVSGKDLRVT